MSAALALFRTASRRVAAPAARFGVLDFHTSAAMGALSSTAPALAAPAAAAKGGSKPAAAAPPAAAARPAAPAGGAGTAKPSATGVGAPKGGELVKVYDFKPVLPRHQAVYKPIFGAAAPDAFKWTPQSQRVGMLMLKAGMAGDYDQWGVRRALTALMLEHAVVTDAVREESRGYNALQIGAGEPKAKNVTKPLAGYFAKQGVAPCRELSEFRVSPDAFLPVGTLLDVRHWVPGQFVNIQGATQGKGFQGAMKRHGFAGQSASHGNSVSHRVLGSTGNRQDPGKVIKGKKMPGHMGAVTVTQECLRVYKIDVKRQLLWVEGAVQGKAGSYVRVYDAPKRPFKGDTPPPFPTYVPTDADKLQAARWAAGAYLPADTEKLLADAGALPVDYEREPAYEFVREQDTIDPFAIAENEENEEV